MSSGVPATELATMEAPTRRVMRAATAVCIALVALLRTLVAHAPLTWFDVDPVADPAPFAGIGPAWSLALDALVLLAAALLLSTLLTRAVRAQSALLALLVLLPTGALLWHATQEADDLWRGMQWLSALTGAVAIAVALRAEPRSGPLRIALAAILLGGLGPLLVRAGVQLLVEHPQTLAYFQAHRAEYLASHGWTTDSPQAVMYERRLAQWEAGAWFGLANLLSSLAAAGAVGFGALALGARRKLEGGTVLVLAVAAAACAALVLVNGSKGAIGALLLGAACAAVAARGRISPRAMGSVAVALVLAAIVAVVVRGMIGEALGERSVLFRWHYLVGAMRAFAGSPVLGTGPAGFSEAYLQLRPNRAPEEVLSAHSAWADWLAALGVGALAWITLMLGAAVAAGRSAMRRQEADQEAPEEIWRRFAPLGAALLVGLASASAMAPEFDSLDAVGIAARFGGIASGMLLAFAAAAAMGAAPRAMNVALLGMAVALLVQAQIEMTLWQPGSNGWVLALVALAAAAPGAGLRVGGAWPRLVLAGCVALIAGIAGATVAGGVLPAFAAEARIEAAAAGLAQRGRERQGGAVVAIPTPLDELRRSAALALASDPSAGRWSARPAVVAAALEQMAAALATQPVSASPGARADLRSEALAFSAAMLARAPCERTAGAAALVAEALLAQPELAADDRVLAAGALRAFAQAQVEFNPRSVRGWRRLAEAARVLGEPREMRAAAQRALECDDSYALDPARMMPARERAQVQAMAGAPSE